MLKEISREQQEVLRIAKDQLEASRKAYADYEEYAESYARQGYRPRRCPHGYNMWTDADIFCGYCEEGEYHWDYMTQAAKALGYARRVVAVRKERVDALMELIRLGAPSDKVMALSAWASASTITR